MRTPLHYSVFRRRAEFITTLLDAGADINAQDDVSGNTATTTSIMMRACENVPSDNGMCRAETQHYTLQPQ